MIQLHRAMWMAVVLCVLPGPIRAESPAPEAGTANSHPSAVVLRELEVGQISPLHVFGSIYLAGQPQPGDLALLKDLGVQSILSLRHVGELDWDEKTAAKAQEIECVHIPFRGADTLTDAVFDESLALLRAAAAEETPLVMHCGAANRVGAVWLAYRMLDGELAWDDALAEAKQVGLRTPEYASRARQYVESHRKSPDAN